MSFSLHIFRLDERHAIFQEYTYKYLNNKFRASLIALLHHSRILKIYRVIKQYNNSIVYLCMSFKNS